MAGIGRRLKTFRKERGWTRRRLASETGDRLSWWTIVEIESGRRKRPAYDTVAILAAALGKSPQELGGEV